MRIGSAATIGLCSSANVVPTARCVHREKMPSAYVCHDLPFTVRNSGTPWSATVKTNASRQPAASSGRIARSSHSSARPRERSSSALS